MGSSQSTHKFTIVNDSNDNIIRISEDVAKRLSQTNVETLEQNRESNSENVVTRQRANSKVQPLEDADIYYPFYTVSSLEVHQEKQKQLENQENYWQKRLDNLKKNHESIDQKLQKEYEQSKHVFDDYKVSKVKPSKMCKIHEESLQKCYSNNQRKTLNCSEQFKTYTACVNEYQQKYMPF